MKAPELLRAHRASNNLTQADLARALETPTANVSRWEAGKRNIGRKWLPKVSQLIGCAPRDLRPDLTEMLGGDQ